MCLHEVSRHEAATPVGRIQLAEASDRSKSRLTDKQDQDPPVISYDLRSGPSFSDEESTESGQNGDSAGVLKAHKAAAAGGKLTLRLTTVP